MRRDTEDPQQGKDNDSGSNRSVTGRSRWLQVLVTWEPRGAIVPEEFVWGAGLGGLLWEDPRVSKA